MMSHDEDICFESHRLELVKPPEMEWSPTTTTTASLVAKSSSYVQMENSNDQHHPKKQI
jgi:hypothetical protein